MFIQNVFSILSNNQFKQNNFNSSISEKLDSTLSLYQFSKDEINELYDYVSNNNLNPKLYEILNKHFPIDITRLEVSVFLPSKYFRALCQYTDVDLSFKNNSLLLQFLLSIDYEEASFLIQYKEVKEAFNKEDLAGLVGKDIVDQFIKHKNIKLF